MFKKSVLSYSILMLGALLFAPATQARDQSNGSDSIHNYLKRISKDRYEPKRAGVEFNELLGNQGAERLAKYDDQFKKRVEKRTDLTPEQKNTMLLDRTIYSKVAREAVQGDHTKALEIYKDMTPERKHQIAKYLMARTLESGDMTYLRDLLKHESVDHVYLFLRSERACDPKALYALRLAGLEPKKTLLDGESAYSVALKNLRDFERDAIRIYSRMDLLPIWPSSSKRAARWAETCKLAHVILDADIESLRSKEILDRKYWQFFTVGQYLGKDKITALVDGKQPYTMQHEFTEEASLGARKAAR